MLIHHPKRPAAGFACVFDHAADPDGTIQKIIKNFFLFMRGPVHEIHRKRKLQVFIAIFTDLFNRLSCNDRFRKNLQITENLFL